jgi:nucleotide-binding universal stress UspA family protein
MTLVVPFDGTELASAALRRATEFASAFDEPVIAFSVVPTGSTEYTRERGWVEPGEPFDTDAVVDDLRAEVERLAPTAEYRYETVGKFTSAGTISTRVRSFAEEVDASMVFVGSENAGHMVVGVSSVGGAIAAEDAYDVVIVRG